MSLFGELELRRRAGDLWRGGVRLLPRQNGLDRLRAAGLVIEPTGTWEDFPEPLELDPSLPSPSVLLQQQREDRFPLDEW